MGRQIAGIDLIGKTIRSTTPLYNDTDLLIVFTDNSFTIIGSYPLKGFDSKIYNEIADLGLIFDNAELLISLKALTSGDLKRALMAKDQELKRMCLENKENS